MAVTCRRASALQRLILALSTLLAAAQVSVSAFVRTLPICSRHNLRSSSCSAPAARRHVCQQRTLCMGRANSFRTAGTESKRQARVSQLLTSELATIISQGHQVKMGAKPLADSLRAKISVVDVSVSPDLRNARIFISVYGDKLEKREAYAWCVRNSSGIRFALSQRLKDMKGVPELTFQQTDVSAAVDVMHLIDQVHLPTLQYQLF
jgi:ribosome-binding factor A